MAQQSGEWSCKEASACDVCVREDANIIVVVAVVVVVVSGCRRSELDGAPSLVSLSVSGQGLSRTALLAHSPPKTHRTPCVVFSTIFARPGYPTQEQAPIDGYVTTRRCSVRDGHNGAGDGSSEKADWPKSL